VRYVTCLFKINVCIQITHINNKLTVVEPYQQDLDHFQYNFLNENGELAVLYQK